MNTLSCKKLKLVLKVVIWKYWLNPIQCVLQLFFLDYETYKTEFQINLLLSASLGLVQIQNKLFIRENPNQHLLFQNILSKFKRIAF